MGMEYGVFGGRFQIIHVGHEYVLECIIKNYSNICIGIVNPNPCDRVSTHEKFAPDKNPLTYFQRVYLWNILLRHHSVEAAIVPHWNPQKSLKLESTFLPLFQESREWIVPRVKDAEFKIEKLKQLGEIVFPLEVDSPELQWISSSEIRRLFDEKINNIPKHIRLKTKDFLIKNKLEEQFIIIPIINDELNPLLFCSGIQESVDTGKKIIFAPIVNVKEKSKWWEFEPKDDGFFTFYQKYEIINNVMKSVNFYDYMVIPIIVKNDQCQAIDSFFPSKKNRVWLIIKGINSSPVFRTFRNENSSTYNVNTIPDDIYNEIYVYIHSLYRQKHFFNNFFNDDESEENTKMSKYNFKGANVGKIYIAEGNIDVQDYSNTYLNDRNSSIGNIIYDILNSKNKDEFKELLQEADKAFNGKSELEIQTIIEDVVKKYVDTPKKKSAILQKVKDFTLTISNSNIAGLLLQAIKNIVFKA